LTAPISFLAVGGDFMSEKMTPKEAEISKHNNFDCLRLVAALMVIISHSFPLTGVLSFEPFAEWLGGYDSGGGIGVAIFFVISGFLVSGSVARRSTLDYLASRALRILPALAVVTCFEVLLIGPIFTTLPLRAYFSNSATWEHLANPMIFGIDFFLPGVFQSLPTVAVNGSLWTLPAECGLYLILPALAFCGGLTKRGAIIAFVGCAAAYFVATGYFGFNWSDQGPEVLKGVRIFSALKLATFFFAGAALWANRDEISLHSGGAIICGATLFACARTSTAMVAYFLCLPYLVMFAALKVPAISLEKIGDLSYGTYLFAHPVQQSLVTIFGPGHIGPYRLLLMAAPIALGIAFLSWHFVEKPALRLRNRKTTTVIAMPTAA
jgi:peptidoglycan/LPS O-acetylase OafA/YrhL